MWCSKQSGPLAATAGGITGSQGDAIKTLSSTSSSGTATTTDLRQGPPSTPILQPETPKEDKLFSSLTETKENDKVFIEIIWLCVQLKVVLNP